MGKGVDAARAQLADLGDLELDDLLDVGRGFGGRRGGGCRARPGRRALGRAAKLHDLIDELAAGDEDDSGRQVSLGGLDGHQDAAGAGKLAGDRLGGAPGGSLPEVDDDHVRSRRRGAVGRRFAHLESLLAQERPHLGGGARLVVDEEDAGHYTGFLLERMPAISSRSILGSKGFCT